MVPYKTFAVADGVIIIAIGNDGQFATFCHAMGVPEWAQDPRFVTGRNRLINREAIEGMMQDLVRGLEAKPLIDKLVALGVPAGPVNTVRDVFADPFVEARDTVHRFIREDGVEIPSVAFPGKLSATPADYRHRPPRVGEQSREVLAEWLALSADELAALEDRGAIVQR